PSCGRDCGAHAEALHWHRGVTFRRRLRGKEGFSHPLASTVRGIRRRLLCPPMSSACATSQRSVTYHRFRKERLLPAKCRRVQPVAVESAPRLNATLVSDS